MQINPRLKGAAFTRRLIKSGKLALSWREMERQLQETHNGTAVSATSQRNNKQRKRKRESDYKRGRVRFKSLPVRSLVQQFSSFSPFSTVDNFPWRKIIRRERFNINFTILKPKRLIGRGNWNREARSVNNSGGSRFLKLFSSCFRATFQTFEGNGEGISLIKRNQQNRDESLLLYGFPLCRFRKHWGLWIIWKYLLFRLRFRINKEVIRKQRARRVDFITEQRLRTDGLFLMEVQILFKIPIWILYPQRLNGSLFFKWEWELIFGEIFEFTE